MQHEGYNQQTRHQQYQWRLFLGQIPCTWRRGGGESWAHHTAWLQTGCKEHGNTLSKHTTSASPCGLWVQPTVLDWAGYLPPFGRRDAFWRRSASFGGDLHFCSSEGLGDLRELHARIRRDNSPLFILLATRANLSVALRTAARRLILSCLLGLTGSDKGFPLMMKS